MERVCEPELMNDPEQSLAYARADFEASHQMIADAFKALALNAREGMTLLDLGCGPGDVTMRLTEVLPSMSIDAVDGAARMLELFEQRLGAHLGCRSEVNLVEGLIGEVSLPRGDYDFIVSSSLLHHLHEPMVLWNTIAELGRVGTRVFVVDLVRPESLDEVARLVESHADGEPEVLREDFRASMCAAFRPLEIEEQLEAAGLADRLSVAMLGERHLVVEGQL